MKKEFNGKFIEREIFNNCRWEVILTRVGNKIKIKLCGPSSRIGISFVQLINLQVDKGYKLRFNAITVLIV